MSMLNDENESSESTLAGDLLRAFNECYKASLNGDLGSFRQLVIDDGRGTPPSPEMFRLLGEGFSPIRAEDCVLAHRCDQWGILCSRFHSSASDELNVRIHIFVLDKDRWKLSLDCRELRKSPVPAEECRSVVLTFVKEDVVPTLTAISSVPLRSLSQDKADVIEQTTAVFSVSETELLDMLFNLTVGRRNAFSQLAESGTLPIDWVSDFHRQLKQARLTWGHSAPLPRRAIDLLRTTSKNLPLAYQAWRVKNRGSQNMETEASVSKINEAIELLLKIKDPPFSN